MLRLRLWLPLLLLLLLAAGPGRAAASRTQETMFQDDNHLLYLGPTRLAATLKTLRGLGVDRLRLTVDWSAYAPDPTSRTRPAFDATKPDAYPDGAFAKLDDAVTQARADGIGVNLNVTAPMPLWASGARVPDADRPRVYAPSVTEYEKFVTAVATRYSGRFTPAGATRALPRVAFWSIWNEPNIPGWLTPQWKRVKGRWVPSAPRVYRKLVGAAYRALLATGHRKDTILIGELASRGAGGPGITKGLKPLAFIRDLYCVDRRFKSLRGRAAQDLSCPKSGFRKANPGLFAATGWAHHPYSLIFAPNVPGADRDYVTLADLPRLDRTLDGIFHHYGSHRKLPLWLTEYGYQTRPPDPTELFSPATQARFLNQADYMTFRNPRVHALGQFELLDDLPNAVGKPWGTFQSGLEFASGKHKASFAAYRLPIWLPKARVRRGARATVWGLLRPAKNGSRQKASVQFRARGGKAWTTLRRVTVTSPRGSFTTTVRIHRAGSVRILWHGIASRAAGVSVR